MKKTKFIAIVLAIAVMLIGAGYAAWTEQLQIDATISTSELNVKFDKISATTPRIYYLASDNPWNPEKDGTTNWNWRQANPNIDPCRASVVVGDQSLEYTFTDMFPGTRASGRYEIHNVGLMPAVLQDVTVTAETINTGTNEEAEVLDAMTFTGVIDIEESDGTNIGHTWINAVPISQLEAKLEAFLMGKCLKPGTKIILHGEDEGEVEGGELIDTQFNFEIPYGSLEGDAGEKEEVKITIDFDFVQHNMFDPTPTVTPGT